VTLAPVVPIVPPPVESAMSADEFEKSRRWDLVKQTWTEVPRHQVRWRCAPEFLQAIAEWQPDRSLVLLGLTGSGKTSACVRLVEKLLKAAVRSGERRHLLPARSLCWTDADTLTRAGGGEDLSDRNLVHRSKVARVLVLDDVAAPSKTIQTTLRERLKGARPTVLTSGVTTSAELARALGGDAVLRHVLDATGKSGEIVVGRLSK